MVIDPAQRIALVGLGRMGLPMAARLRARGMSVAGFDLRGDRRAEAASAGISVSETFADAAGGADVLITVLTGAPEVAAILPEAMQALRPGATWIEMSTASPPVARAIAAAARARGVGVLDAPVGGDPQLAREGRLTAFAGGEPALLAACRPLLEILADTVIALGPFGSGYLGKLLVNLLWFEQAAGVAEALALADRAGLDPHALRSALTRTAAASRFIERDAPALLAGDDLPSFPLARTLEQIETVRRIGDELGAPLELAETVARLHADALAHFGDVDGELLAARLVAERAGASFAARETGATLTPPRGGDDARG